MYVTYARHTQLPSESLQHSATALVTCPSAVSNTIRFVRPQIAGLCTPQLDVIVELLGTVPCPSTFPGVQDVQALGRTCVREGGGRCFDAGYALNRCVLTFAIH